VIVPQTMEWLPEREAYLFGKAAPVNCVTSIKHEASLVHSEASCLYFLGSWRDLGKGTMKYHYNGVLS